MLFFRKTRDFIVEEKDITSVLKVINDYSNVSITYVANCGWAKEPTMWFIMFKSSDNKYERIIDDLTKMGSFKVEMIIPKGIINLYFKKSES